MSNKSWSNADYNDNPFSEQAPIKSSAPPSLYNKTPTAYAAEDPAWLKDADQNVPLTSNAATSSSSSYQPPGSTNKKVPQMILFARVGNMVLSVAMIITGVLGLLSSSVTTGVIACYVIAFSCLLCCFETHFRQVAEMSAENFGFLYNAKARGLFILFIAFLLFNLGVLGIVIGCAAIFMFAFHLYLVVKHPEFEEMQRADAQSEIKQYLVSHPEYAEGAVRHGVKFAAENPDLVIQGANSYRQAQQSQQSQSSTF